MTNYKKTILTFLLCLLVFTITACYNSNPQTNEIALTNKNKSKTGLSISNQKKHNLKSVKLDYHNDNRLMLTEEIPIKIDSNLLHHDPLDITAISYCNFLTTLRFYNDTKFLGFGTLTDKGTWFSLPSTKNFVHVYVDTCCIFKEIFKSAVLKDPYTGKVISAKYNNIFANDETHNVFTVSLNDKYGFIDEFGEEIVKPKYDLAKCFYCDRAVVKSNEKWGYVNTLGEVVIPIKYDYCNDFYDNLAAVNKNDKWGFIDTSGKMITPCIYDSVRNFHNGLAAVKLNSKWGFINTSGKIIIPPLYYGADDFSNGKCLISMKYYSSEKDAPCAMYGLIDRFGNYIIKPDSIYKIGQDQNNNLTKIFLYENGKYYGGIANNSGEILVKFGIDEYKKTSSYFHDGLLWVKSPNCSEGFVNKKNEVVVPIEYKTVWDFKNGTAIVQCYDNKKGIIDTKGNYIIAPNYDSIERLETGLFEVSIKNKHGIMNIDGTYLIQPQYEDLTHISKHFLLAKSNGKWGVIDYSEKIHKDFQYDSIYKIIDSKYLYTTGLLFTKDTSLSFVMIK